MRRIISLVLISVIVLCTGGCYAIRDYKMRRNERKTANKVFEYLQEEDTDSLEGLFSEEADDNNDIEEQLDDFFDAIDGRIESYDHVNITVTEKWIDNYQVTYALISVVFYEVTTDTGTEYHFIEYQNIVIDEDNPDELGLFSIRVLGQDDDIDLTVGGY